MTDQVPSGGAAAHMVRGLPGRPAVPGPRVADRHGEQDGTPRARFIWRLQTEDGNATAVHAFEWDQAGSAGVLVNMSVWKSVEALAAFVYSDAHRQVLRQRRQWFERMAEAYVALWWIPRGHTPTTDEAEERILHLRESGPMPYAFTLREHFPPPDAVSPGPIRSPEGWNCPA